MEEVALGIQRTPRRPSSTSPCARKKESTALSERRVVVWFHSARTLSRWFRLTGSPAASSAARTYSTISSDGFAPRRANRNRGTGVTIGTGGA